MEEQIIRQVIETAYLNGALNNMNTADMRKGYHPDFAIFFPLPNGVMGKLPLEDWIEIVENDKKRGVQGKALRCFNAEFLQIDVSGMAAFVKLKLSRNTELVFTDYITLLKLGDKWQIVSKVYDLHLENPWNLTRINQGR